MFTEFAYQINISYRNFVL